MRKSGKNKRRKALIRHRLEVEAESRWHRWLWPAILATIVIGAFLLRVLPQLDIVLVDGDIIFKEVDPWYHMRLIDSMVRNFPIPLTYDAYALYPDGTEVGFQPLLAWLVVGISYIVNLGQPSQHTVELVGAFLPPVLGAAICVPVYLIGKEMGGRVVGLVATFLVAVLPTQLLFRSLLGFTDHHVLEALLSVMTVLFLLYALNRRKLRHALFAGIFLGLYLLNWHGAVFFVWLLWLWFIVQFFNNWRKGNDLGYLTKVGMVTFGMAALLFAPYLVISAIELLPKVIMLSLALATPPLLFTVSKLTATWLKGIVLMLGAGCGILAVVCAIDLRMVLHALLLFKAVFSGFNTTIAEAKASSIGLLMQNYGLCFPLFLAGFVLAVVKRQALLILIWSLVLFIALVGQRRWDYYFTINVSLMSAFFLWWAASMIKKELRLAAVALCCIFLLALPVVGNISSVVRAANHITPGWYGALLWMRDNTSEPMPAESYYANNVIARADYSVLAWWDYGHWITRIAHRVPLASPAQQFGNELGAFFVAQNPEDAEVAIEGMNVRYVIIDGQIMTGKFYALVKYANRYRSIIGLEPYDNSRANLKTLRDGSMMALIYGGGAPGYELVYQKEDVRIFERVQMDTDVAADN